MERPVTLGIALTVLNSLVIVDAVVVIWRWNFAIVELAVTFGRLYYVNLVI